MKELEWRGQRFVPIWFLRDLFLLVQIIFLLRLAAAPRHFRRISKSAQKLHSFSQTFRISIHMQEKNTMKISGVSFSIKIFQF